jgi:hypothetical protein
MKHKKDKKRDEKAKDKEANVVAKTGSKFATDAESDRKA